MKLSMQIMAVFMLETLKLSKTLKPSRDDFNVKYKNLPFLYLALKSSRDNFNVSSINACNAPKRDEHRAYSGNRTH